MNQTASFYPQLTNGIKTILEHMSKYIIKESKPIIVIDKYDWLVCALSLLSKQVNLCESAVLLLENGMEQEAFLLVRSQFNNLLWIKYICEAESDDRIKEYIYQPYVTQIKKIKQIQKLISENANDFDQRFHEEAFQEKMNDLICSNQQILKEANMENLKTKQIFDLAKQDIMLFEMYLTMYNEGSKIEHSDISTLNRYRDKILNDYTNTQIFSINLSISDKIIWYAVIRNMFICLYMSFDTFYNRIKTKENHLFQDTSISKAAYDNKDFNKVLLLFSTYQKMLDEIEQETK